MTRRRILWSTLVASALIIPALFIVASRPMLRENLWGQGWNVLSSFTENVTTRGPVAWLRTWVSPEGAKTASTREEDLARYQLRILSKSIDNYFRILLRDTAQIAQKDALRSRMNGTSSLDSSTELRGLLADHLGSHLDLLEISLFDRDGGKIQSLRYKSADEYKLGEKIFEQLKTKDNLLLRHGASANLVLVTAVKANGKLEGAVSQTIHPVFFTKILDFLGLQDRLFYLRTGGGDLIVDNLDSSKKAQRQTAGVGNLFVRQLTTATEASVPVKLDGVEYSLGVIMEKNNWAGHLVSFLALVLLAGIGAGLSYLAVAQLTRMFQDWKAARKSTKSAEPSSSEAEQGGAKPLSDEALTAIDREIERLQSASPDGPKG